MKLSTLRSGTLVRSPDPLNDAYNNSSKIGQTVFLEGCLDPEDRGIRLLRNVGNCSLVGMVMYHKFSFFLLSLLLFEFDSRDGRTDRQKGGIG